MTKRVFRSIFLASLAVLLAAVVLMVVYGIWRSQLVAAALMTLCLVLLAAFAILLGVNIYYEKRM